MMHTRYSKERMPHPERTQTLAKDVERYSKQDHTSTLTSDDVPNNLGSRTTPPWYKKEAKSKGEEVLPDEDDDLALNGKFAVSIEKISDQGAVQRLDSVSMGLSTANEL